jgi:hypothetical protein
MALPGPLFSSLFASFLIVPLPAALNCRAGNNYIYYINCYLFKFLVHHLTPMKFIIALIVQEVKRYVVNWVMHFDKLLVKINKVNQMAGIDVDFMTLFCPFSIPFLFFTMRQTGALGWSRPVQIGALHPYSCVHQ